MFTEPVPVLAVLGALVAVSEWLAQRTWLRHLGSALLVIVLTAVVANAGLIPVYGGDDGLYDAVFGTVAPMAVFWLLLGVDLRKVLAAGAPILGLFLIGSVGVFFGVFLAMLAVSGEQVFGEYASALGGMFVGTYVGGSANFNAVAIEYGIPASAPQLYAGATVVDAAATTVWMIVGVLVPRLKPGGPHVAPTSALAVPADPDAQTVSPFDLGAQLFLGGAALVAARSSSEWLSASLGFAVPSMLVLTIVALTLAQLPVIQRLRGARVLGMFTVLVFLAVIGALCDVEALLALRELGPPLIAFVALILLVHGALTYGVARVARIDPEIASVASQANIGGGTSALALARSLGREDLVLPAILIGALGTALGNFLGFGMVGWLEA